MNASRPDVEDNVAVKSVTSTFNIHASLTETTIFTFVADDEANNTAECIIIANVTGEFL